MDSPDPADVPAPVGAYVSAIFSFLFVTGGIWVAFVLSVVAFARALDSIPAAIIPLIGLSALVLGVALGGISGYFAFVGAKRRAREKLAIKARMAPKLPPWRRGLVVYPSSILLGSVIGAVVAAVWNRGANDFRDMLVVGSVFGGFAGGLAGAVLLTVMREFFPLPITVTATDRNCVQCGEIVPAGATQCPMCGSKLP